MKGWPPDTQTKAGHKEEERVREAKLSTIMEIKEGFKMLE
jgi:hypothetical protein